MEEITLRSVYREIKAVAGTIAIRGRRPALAWIGVLFVLWMAIAFGHAFWRWANGASLPEIPGGFTTIAVAFIPIIPALVDQVSRHFEVRATRAGIGMGPGAANGEA